VKARRIFTMYYLISPTAKQYKANLHCHSTRSDGKKTPEQLKEDYKKNGYSILAITDHEAPKIHTSLSDSEFIMLTGYEAYIRETGHHDPYHKEIHTNLFARDPKNDACICFDDIYCKYLPTEEKEKLHKVGSTAPREYSVKYINEFIKTAIDNGYICTYNHPVWSMEDEETILSYEGIFSLEIANYSSIIINGLEYSGALYDKMLRCGKRIYCHGADDNHNKAPDGSRLCDSYGAYTMIMPKEFTYDSVFSAMEKGDMYFSMGPEFYEVSVDGRKVHVECSDVDSITCFFGSKKPKRVFASDGCPLTAADFEIDERAKYVRISIIDKNGKIADTRGYFPDEYGL
jgi:hypothetical protein